jgi:hypothetical protein
LRCCIALLSRLAVFLDLLLRHFAKGAAESQKQGQESEDFHTAINTHCEPQDKHNPEAFAITFAQRPRSKPCADRGSH